MDMNYFLLILIILVSRAELNQYVNLTFESDSYIAIIGQSLKMTCIGENLSPADIVWIVYSINNPSEQRVIFSDSIYVGNSSRKYSIETELMNDKLLATSLSIYNVQENDELFGYQCVCNIYKKCSMTNHAKSNASIVAIRPTTPPNSLDESFSFHIICTMIFGCLLLWIFNMQYVVRLNLKNDLKTINLVLIIVDTIFELTSYGSLIVTNFYCSGYGLLKPLTNFDYSYLKIISAILSLVFAILLFIISVIIFCLNQHKIKKAIVTVESFRPSSSTNKVFITNNIINPTINNSENKIIEASISSIERSLKYKDWLVGRNLSEDYRSITNLSDMSNIRLDQSSSLLNDSDANLIEKDFSTNYLNNSNKGSFKRVPSISSYKNDDRLKSNTVSVRTGSSVKNLKINRYNPSKIDSTQYNANNGFRFENVRSFNAHKNEDFFIKNFQNFQNPYEPFAPNVPNWVNMNHNN
ncbi:unnamed protein product [Brachionus calyciflorus]|uniref:Ig-like domain-containing protein n=1 Tax=Brachionus calyciflorus TaxID=104777 RepID=A0A813MTR4_9BILA|nr:unnamed protein product [Brachionus calyciflorus]